jgi:hypothetical protein
MSITRGDILNRLAMGLSATTAARLFAAVKVRKIILFAGLVSGGDASVNMQWVSEYGLPKVISDISSSATYPARVESAPPKDSIASFWSLAGVNESQVMLELQVPTGGYIDLHISAVLQNGALSFDTTGVTITVAGATAATIGAPALDHSGSKNAQAVGWINYA